MQFKYCLNSIQNHKPSSLKWCTFASVLYICTVRLITWGSGVGWGMFLSNALRKPPLKFSAMDKLPPQGNMRLKVGALMAK